MKTSIKTLTTICTVIISLNVNAQRNHNGNQPQTSNQGGPSNNNNQSDKHGWGSNHHHGGGYWGENVSIHVGGNPYYYYGPNYSYGYGYNNNYNVKRAARNSIRQSANVIGQALNFSEWNDTYSPWLAKAIRHQQYAKQLYFWGDYAGALNHAERAGFLAWNTLSYFNNSYGYDDGFAGNGYPNPYSDPNNPYYRQNNPNTNAPANGNSDEDYGYRKSSSDNSTNNEVKRETNSNNSQKNSNTEIDSTLPQNKLSDKELLKMNAKDLDIE